MTSLTEGLGWSKGQWELENQGRSGRGIGGEHGQIAESGLNLEVRLGAPGGHEY